VNDRTSDRGTPTPDAPTSVRASNRPEPGRRLAVVFRRRCGCRFTGEQLYDARGRLPELLDFDPCPEHANVLRMWSFATTGTAFRLNPIEFTLEIFDSGN
jgi:hypothetical protein